MGAHGEMRETVVDVAGKRKSEGVCVYLGLNVSMYNGVKGSIDGLPLEVPYTLVWYL